MHGLLLGLLLASISHNLAEPNPLIFRAARAASASQSFVSYVFDGDSLIWTRAGQKLSLRLYGIDAPERGQAQADQARQHLQRLLQDQPIQVHLLYRDRYQRWIARLTLTDGRDVGQEMVKAGLAWWYRQYAPQDTSLARFENQARQAHRGIWSQVAPQAPWLYRAQKRNKHQHGF